MKIEIPASALWSKEALESFLKNFRSISRGETIEALPTKSGDGKSLISKESAGSSPDDGLGLINRKA